MAGVKNWLRDSYKTHGNSTDSTSKGNGRNMDDTPTGKMRRVAKQSSDMKMTKTAGNKSGGGKGPSLAKSVPANGKATYMKGLMRGNNRGG